MKLKQIISYSVGALLSASMLCACTDWLDYQPNDKQSEEQQFSTKDGFYSAVNGVYTRMSGSSLYGKYLTYELVDLLGQCYTVEQSDEATYYEYLRALTKWDYTNETVLSALSSIWSNAYSTIMNINVVIENLDEDAEGAGVLPASEYRMLKGEMLAARAMIHLDLLRLFGPVYANNPDGQGVPYNESTKAQILPILTASQALTEHVIPDLTQAEALLIDSDPVTTEGPRAEYDDVTLDNSQRYRQLRLNYYATVLLTARAYLWGGDYANALVEARKLTDDAAVRTFFPEVNAATLLANSSDPDRMFSSECLFGYYYKNRGLIYDYTFGGTNTSKSLLIPRSGYVNGVLFTGSDAGDYRYQSQWADGTTLDGLASKQLVKFKTISDSYSTSTDGTTTSETVALMKQKFYGSYCSLIKLSEAYYIAAECLGTSTSPVYSLADAWGYLNSIRAARGLGAYDVTTSASTLKAQLGMEYTREFYGEGQKFFYFKRRNLGFDNDFNGREEIKIMTSPAVNLGFWVIPASYKYTDDATDAEKEQRFVLPLPTSELDNR